MMPQFVAGGLGSRATVQTYLSQARAHVLFGKDYSGMGRLDPSHKEVRFFLGQSLCMEAFVVQIYFTTAQSAVEFTAGFVDTTRSKKKHLSWIRSRFQ